MILFVDDLEQRFWNFQKAFPEKTNILWVTSSENAVNALMQFGDIDEVWLDHDGDTGTARRMWQPGHPEIPTFYIVAQFLAAMHFAGKVYIHTGNPAGADRMLKVLKEYDVAVERPDGATLVAVWGGEP